MHEHDKHPLTCVPPVGDCPKPQVLQDAPGGLPLTGTPPPHRRRRGRPRPGPRQRPGEELHQVRVHVQGTCRAVDLTRAQEEGGQYHNIKIVINSYAMMSLMQNGHVFCRETLF